MFNHLTKIKIILFIILLVGFFVNKDFILDSIKNRDQQLAENESSILISQSNNLDKNNNQVKTITNKVKIALLVYDLGLMKKSVDLAMTLPQDVALGFSAYSESLSSLTRDSLNQKHGTLLLLPTKPTNYSQNDPGPLALFMNNATGTNRSTFVTLLDSLVSDQVGFYLSNFSVVINSEEQGIKLLHLLEEAQDKIKYLLYLDSDKSSLLTKLFSSSSFKNKAIIIDRILDKDLDALEVNFQKLKEEANEKGLAVGAISGNFLSIKKLKTLLEKEQDFIELVSLDSVIKNK
jgi:polysaccharide deacetylase 2 family uncharacterized protein YibQ